MESSDQNRPSICETIYPASFWQVGLSELVLSKYSNKSHNFKNLIFIITLELYVRLLFSNAQTITYKNSYILYQMTCFGATIL